MWQQSLTVYTVFFIMLTIFIIIYVSISIIFIKNKKFFFFNVKMNNQNWIDVWNINTNISKLENIDGSSWNLYYKYKLTMITSWHILEERFMVFIMIVISLLF